MNTEALAVSNDAMPCYWQPGGAATRGGGVRLCNHHVPRALHVVIVPQVCPRDGRASDIHDVCASQLLTLLRHCVLWQTAHGEAQEQEYVTHPADGACCKGTWPGCLPGTSKHAEAMQACASMRGHLTPSCARPPARTGLGPCICSSRTRSAPGSISLSQVLIGRHDVHASACEGIQVGRQGGRERLALSSLHLCNMPLVQCSARNLHGHITVDCVPIHKRLAQARMVRARHGSSSCSPAARHGAACQVPAWQPPSLQRKPLAGCHPASVC